MKTLPYFRWYPADAETDHLYASLSDAELGFFHRCLNRSWINGGLPADLDELSAIMRVTRQQLDRVWSKVGRCFQLSEVTGQLVNRRQESERTYATTKSERNTNAVRTRYERRTNEPQRAYGCVSSISSLKEGVGENKKPHAADMDRNTPSRAREFADQFPDQSDRDSTVREYLSIVEPSEQDAVFACLARYKESDRVARGAVMAGWKWLRQQKANKWDGQWPKARASPNAPAQFDGPEGTDGWALL